MTRIHLLARLLLALAALLLVRSTRAEPGGPSPRGAATPARPLVLTAEPLLGGSAPSGSGWFMVNLRLRSLVDEPLDGEIEVSTEASWSSDAGRTTTLAPFSLAPRGGVALSLPTHGFEYGAPSLHVFARAADGQELADFEVTTTHSLSPTLLVLNTPHRLGHWLRDQRLRVSGRPSSSGYSGISALNVAAPSVNPTSGELAVPDLAAGYASATLVLASSSVLARLGARAEQALADWVLGGGALAVTIDRPEDLRAPWLVALAGGPITRTEAPPGLDGDRIFETASEPDLNRLIERRLRPSPAVAQLLVGHAGGNLRPSPWGSAASYGLGELHLLAVNPLEEPAVSDPWVHLSLVELVRHAWDRDVHVALPHARGPIDGGATREIRRLVDPNQRTRWAIVVATLLLLAYAMLAGPLNFFLAARRGRPLRALLLLPVWSLLTLSLVVGLGLIAKGVRGQVRHVALIEAGAGMARGAVVRFRGFYAPSARELVVRARADGNVLDVTDAGGRAERVLVVDRDGARLERFRAKPWQTVLVREDGFVDLGAGISLVDAGGDVVVKNRLGRHLVGVLVRLGDGRTFHFPRLEDGQAVTATSGARVASVGMPTGLGTGLDAAAFDDVLDGDEAGLGATWAALESYAYGDTDWWPSDTPVLIGQIVGGAGDTTDSGLALVQDRLLVRVVGFGGDP